MKDGRSPKRVVFVIWSPNYSYTSAGIRCLFLLCHHLNRLGYEAYITGRHAPEDLSTRFIDRNRLDELRAAGVQDIVVYPEVSAGNVLSSRNVVRYLLNKPGHLNLVAMEDYGSNDYLVHYAKEFLPPGTRSRLLRIPSLDTRIFHQRTRYAARDGFIIYANRVDRDEAAIPHWMQPRHYVLRQQPLKPQQLAEWYRSSRALVTWERTAAMSEAILCGCPVVIMPTPSFDHRPVVRRNLGCGIAIGPDPERLARATRSLPVAQAWYHLRSMFLPRRIEAFAVDVLRHFGFPRAASRGVLQ